MNGSKRISHCFKYSINRCRFNAKQHQIYHLSMCHVSNYSDYDDSSLFRDDQINPVLKFVESYGLQEIHDYKFRTYHAQNKQIVQLRECPLCPPHKNHITNLWTLGIFLDKGSWNCFRCGHSGNWPQLRQIFSNYGTQCGDAFDEYYEFQEAADNQENEESEICQISRNDYISEKEINFQNEMLLQEKPLLSRLMSERNLSSKCFRDYKCGLKYKHFPNIKQKQQCITFPMYQYKDNKFVATKYKTRCVSNNIKQFDQYPAQNEGGLFGFDNKNNNEQKLCIITEGEYDSMAIYYGTDYKIKPVSLPIGANNISDKLIHQLSQIYREFLLFLDWDEAGQKNAAQLKHKMMENNVDNVEIIKQKDHPSLMKIKDANDIMIKYKEEGPKEIQKLLRQYTNCCI